jgi:hypothetical protein
MKFLQEQSQMKVDKSVKVSTGGQSYRNNGMLNAVNIY